MVLKSKRILFSFVILFGLTGLVSGQTFTFECIGGYLTNADANCDICTGQTTSRLFNGLYIKQNGVKWRWIDCPFIIKQQGNNLIFQELINPNPETVTINLLASGFSTINGFKDSTACMCAAQDSSWIGGGGDPSITNEGILGVAAGGANDALLTSNTSTAVGVTYAGSTTITVTETPAANGGTITFQADTSLLATVNDIRNNTFDTVATYADLRLYDKGQKLIYVSGHGIEGFFERIATGPADDDGTVIVGDYSWERVYDRSALNVQWFGAVGDSTTDDGAAIQAAIDEAMARQNTSVYIPAGKYRYTTTLRMYKPIGVSIYGAGMDNTYLFPVNVTGIYVRTDSTELVTDPKYGVFEGRDMMFKDFSMLRVGTNSYSVQAIGIHILGTFNRKMENIRVEEFFATSGTASGKGIGIKIDNPYDPVGFPSLADEATQHNMFENIYVNECDTGIVFRLLNTVNMHNVKIDESKKVGIVLKNGVIWKGGLVQGSVNCGIYITEDHFPIKGIYLDGVHFETNSRTNPKYGTIYKGSATTLTNFEAVNCRFSQSDSSKVFNLRSVRYANITNNTYAVNLYDTLYFNNCNSIILGNDNYYEATTTSASSNITFLSGNLTVSTEALNGLTLQKDAPGPYALNVGGTAIVDDNLGVGTTGLPARKFHVQGEARITDLTTDTPTLVVGADADGDLGAITVGTGLLLSGGTISTTVPSSVFSTSVALPTVVGNTREIGVLTHNEGGRAALVSIDVIADVSGLGNVKRYFFPLAFNSTGGAWVKLLPAVSNAVESTTQDFELEMRTNTSGTPTGGIDTVRIVRTGGTAAGNVDVIIQYYGVDIDANTFTSTSNTSTSAVTTTYSEQSIAQAANKVGVNTWQPARSLHVEGEVRIADLTTDTPTRLVGADAEGDLDDVTLATGLTMPSGVLTPADNSATNEAWTIDAETGDTEVISSQTVLFDGAGINTTNYDAGTNTLTITGTEVDGSVSNEIETFVSTSDATSHTVTLAPGTTSVQLIEGSNVTLTTGGTAANATVTIASAAGAGTDLSYTGASSPVTLNSSTGTDVTVTAGTGISLAGTATDLTITNTGDLSATNEAWTVDADDADTELITTQTVKFQGGGINVTDYIPGTDILTITGTEVDGSTTNEAWTVDADAGDTEVISNQTLLVAGGGIVSTSYNAAGNTLTVTGTEVDGSITNEGILGVAAGGGNDALLTSNTSTASGVTIAGGGIAAVTESTSANGGTITITATEVDGSTTNEAWTIDGDDAETEVISSQTVKFQGAGINVTDYDAATNVMLITGTEVDGSTSNEIQTITGSGSGTTYALDLSLAGGSIGLIEGTGITIDRTGNDFTFNAASGGTNYQTWRDDGVAATQRPNANFVSNTDIAFTLTDDAGNTETEVTADIPANAVDNAELRQSAALSVIGRSANSTGDVADIAAAADGDVLRRSGTTLGFGDVDLTLGVTGTLPVGNGGTGATNLVNNRVLTGNGTSPIVDEANLTFDGTLLTTTGNQYTTGALSIGTSSTAYKLRVRGAGATSATNSLLIENSTPTSILTIRDDTRITLNQTNSVSASYDGIGSTGSITSTGNSVTGVHNRYTLTSSNDGTVTGNTQYGALYGHTIPALTQSSGAYGIFNTLTNNSTAATGQMTSMFFRTTENENTTTLNNRFGCRGEVLFTGSGDFHNGYGVRGDVTATTTGRWNSGTGFYTAVTNAVTSYGADMVITNNRGTANTQRGIRIQNNVSGSGVVVDNAYGIELRGDASSSGVITTYYGLYQNTIPSGATSYFLYGNQSAARSYLSGTLAVGTNSNASKLFVRGTGATSATMAATFENSGGSDIMNLRDDQRVGIITASPNRTLEVQGEVRITDLVTDTPTKIVGADADGDLDTVGINGYNELHITNGALGTNFHTTISPATLTTVTNNWNPTGLATAWIIELSGNGSFVLLTGITAPTFNKSLTLYNNGDNSILLPREFSTSSAGNRFAFEAVLFPGKQVEIRYSVGESRWLLKSKDGLYDDVQHLYANHLFQSPVSITTSDFDFWEITSEAAASLVAPTSGVWSGVSVNTGADAGGLGYVSSKEAFFQTDNSTGTVTWAYCKAVIRTPSSLSDGSNDYAIRVGFNAANGGGGATNGMYFQYNHGLVSGNWGTATTNAGNTQLNNSGVAVTTSTVYVLEMYVQPGLAVSFFINGVRVATNDTFVNTGDDMYISAEIEKSIGTTQRDLQIFTLQGSAALVNQP